MHIGIFAPMTGRQAGGPETYDTGLVRGLAKVDHANAYTVFCVNQPGAALLTVDAPSIETVVLQPRQRWMSIPVSLPLQVRRRRLDLVHATFVAPPYVPAPLVFTLLDISPVTHPQFLPWALRLRLWPLWRNSIRVARIVICISEFTRGGLLEAFKFPADRAVVAHLGVHPRYRPIAADETRRTLARYGVTEPYILHVGKLQARKNILRLLEAFHLLKQDGSIPHKLVLVGRKTWTSSEVGPLIERLKLQPHIIHTGHVPDEDTPHFYSGASVLAYPTLYRGLRAAGHRGDGLQRTRRGRQHHLAAGDCGGRRGAGRSVPRGGYRRRARTRAARRGAGRRAAAEGTGTRAGVHVGEHRAPHARCLQGGDGGLRWRRPQRIAPRGGAGRGGDSR